MQLIAISVYFDPENLQILSFKIKNINNKQGRLRLPTGRRLCKGNCGLKVDRMLRIRTPRDTRPGERSLRSLLPCVTDDLFMRFAASVACSVLATQVGAMRIAINT